MKIAVVGTGYVGLVAGTCFAETGNKVICVDVDEKKVEKMRRGESPIYEPGLTDLLKRNLKEGRLNFTTNLEEAVDASDVIFSAVGTPSSVDGSADLTVVKKVAEDIGKLMKSKKIVVNKSTVPVGTAKIVSDIISSNSKYPVSVVSNPEFLKEGSAIEDFLRPDRVVIGTDDDDAWEVMHELYLPFVRQGNPIIRMTNVSAEMTKYAANSMLATKISFMNEVARLCEEVGADVKSVRSGIASDQRIGRHFLYAGPGYGGSCFPKDVKALIKTAKENGIDMKVVTATEEANEKQKRRVGEKALRKYAGDVKGKTFAVWGLAFKANTDDMREAPALELLDQLLSAGAKVQAFDPEARDTAIAAMDERKIPRENFTLTDSPYSALEGADCFILMTEWREFQKPEWEDVKKHMKGNHVIDGRNLWKRENVEEYGFTYEGIGR